MNMFTFSKSSQSFLLSGAFTIISPTLLNYSYMVIFNITSRTSKRQPSNVSFNPPKSIFVLLSLSLSPYFALSHSLCLAGRYELILHKSVQFVASRFVHFQWVPGDLRRTGLQHQLSSTWTDTKVLYRQIHLMPPTAPEGRYQPEEETEAHTSQVLARGYISIKIRRELCSFPVSVLLLEPQNIIFIVAKKLRGRYNGKSMGLEVQSVGWIGNNGHFDQEVRHTLSEGGRAGSRVVPSRPGAVVQVEYVSLNFLTADIHLLS